MVKKECTVMDQSHVTKMCVMFVNFKLKIMQQVHSLCVSVCVSVAGLTIHFVLLLFGGVEDNI